MKTFGHKNEDLLLSDELAADLKCDFPARESFESSLLGRLLDYNEQGVSSDEDDDFRIIQLSDEDLSMLSAAGGHQTPPEWL